MQDKYLLSIGAGIILLSFGILVYYMVSTGIDSRLESENKTIGFEQLQELNDASRDSMLNNTVVEKFKDVVGTAIDEVDERITTAINNTEY